MKRLLFLLSINLLSAQTNKVDSLFNSLNTNHTIEKKIEILKKVSNDNKNVFPDYMYQIAIKMDSMSKKANYQKGIYYSQENIGDYYYEKSKPDSALLYFNKNVEVALKMQDSLSLIRAYIYIGNTYTLKRELQSTVYYFDKAFDIAVKTNNIRHQATILHNTGNVYYYINDFDNALTCYQKALSLLENNSKSELLYKYNLSKVYIQKENYIKALELLEEVSEKLKTTKNYQIPAFGYLKLAEVHEKLGHTPLAIKYYKQILDLDIFVKKDVLVNVYISLGRLYFEKEQIEQALQQAVKGYKLAQEIGEADFLSGGNRLLFDIYTYNKNFKKSNFHSSEALKYLDLLSDARVNNATTQRLIAYQKKLKDMEEANEKNLLKLSYNRNILIAILSFIAIICFLLIYKNNRIRKEKNIAKLNLKQKIVLEEKIHKIEDNIAADLHDNFGNRLTAIQSAYTIVKEYNLEEKVKDDNYFKFSSHLEDKLFQLSTDIKDLLWAMNQNNNKVFPLIDRVLKIVNAFEETTNKKVEVEIEMKKNYGFPKYTVKQLLLIIKEIIHNFDKHSKSDLLKIKFTSINDKIHIVTQDFGVGFKISDLTRINGLNNIKKRAESIGFSTKFNSEINKFTKIELISTTKLLV